MKNNTHTMKTPSPILEKRTPNLRQRRTGALALLALLALAGGTLNAVATDGTWSNAAGGAYDTAANWSGGVNIADGVGATGAFTVSLTSSNRTISMATSRTLGTWNLGQGGRTLTFSPSVGVVLTLDNTGSTNAVINVANGGKNIVNNVPIELMDSLDIVSVLANGQSLTLGTMTSKNGALMITNKSVGGGSPTTVFNGIISDGSGTLSFKQITAGFSSLAAANTFTGTTTVSGGILRLDNALALQNSALDTTASILGDAVGNGNGLRIHTTVGTGLTLGGLIGNKNFSATGGVFNPTTSGYGAITALTLNPGTGKSYSYSGAIANGATGMTLTKTGTGTQILSGTNTYTGNTAITAGTLALGAGGSIDNTPLISIAAGGTFDASAISSYTVSGSTTLSASGSSTPGTQATIIGGTTVSLGSQGITLTWGGGTSGTDNTHPCLVVSQGALTLSNNALTINGSSLLGNGTYTLISVTSGTISGSPSASVTGSAIDPTKTNAVSVSGGSVILTVSSASATPTISAPATLPGSLATTYGTASSPQSVAVSGANLGSNITATAQSGFEVSSDASTYAGSASFPQSGGSASGTLYVRLAATASAAGSYNGVAAAILSSGIATPVNVATTASGNSVSMLTPTVAVSVGTYYFNGSQQGPSSYTTSPSGDTGTPTWSYAGTGGTSYGPSPTPPIAIGTYTATVSLAADSQFNAASSSATAFTIDAPPSPSITTPATLPAALSTSHGTASGAQHVSVAGTYLTANITATAQTGFEVATTSGGPYSGLATFTQSGGNASGTLYVRLATTVPAGSHDSQSAAILSSSGATPVGVATTASGNTVAKGNQTITFALGTAVAKGLGGAPFADTATANSGLTITYSSDNTDVATVDESGTVTLIATGTTHILANQVGDDNWNAATQVSQTLTVALISNGGFETNTGSNGGNATDWTKVGDAFGIERGLNNIGWGFNSGASASGGFYQTLGAPLVAGLKYQLTYYLATWAGANTMHVRVGKFSGGNYCVDGSYSPLPISAIDTNPTGAWTLFSHTFTAVGGEDTVFFGSTGLSPNTNPPNSDPGGKYDNVVLSIVPYTLGYDANGGSGTAPGPYTGSYGTTTTTAPADTFARNGYTFAGWNTAADGSGTTYAAAATFTYTADTTLYAQWTSNASYTSWAAAQSPPLIGGASTEGADGLTNLIIYAIDGLKTDHTNGSPGIFNPATRQLSFTKRPDAIANGDVSWAIETSSDLEHWTTEVSQPKGDPATTISYTLPADAGTLFSRLVVSQ